MVQQSGLVRRSGDRKRRRNILDPVEQTLIEAPRKQAQQSTRNAIVETTPNEEANQVGDEAISPIQYWTTTQNWPKRFAEQTDESMSHLLARQKSSHSLRRKRSEPASVAPSSSTPSFNTLSDQKPREAKSAPYRDLRYETLLATKGSFMIQSDLGRSEESITLYVTLLQKEQAVHEQSLFRDDLYEQTCQKTQNRNEARVI